MSDSLPPHELGAHQDPRSLTVSRSLLRFMAIESVMLSNHLILCHPILLLPSTFPSSLFQWISSSHQVAKVLELHFSISLPVNIQGWFPLGLTSLISLPSEGLSRILSSTTIWKHHTQLLCLISPSISATIFSLTESYFKHLLYICMYTANLALAYRMKQGKG